LNIRTAATAATSAALAVGIIAAGPALAATAFTVKGTETLSPGDSPEQILPGYFAGYDVVAIDYPASPVGMDSGIGQAADGLHEAIMSTEGEKVASGYSQGAIVLTYEKQRLMALPPEERPAADELTFVHIGDLSGPGGIMQFLPPGTYIPIIGVTMVGPVETPYDTVYVTREYDGYADFPDHPLNLISTANAVAGIVYVHYSYVEADLDLDKVPEENVTTTVNSQGGTTTSYLIPTEKLPLVQPLRDIGVPEPVVAAIEQPLKQVVDAGYDRNTVQSNETDTTPAAVSPSTVSAKKDDDDNKSTSTPKKPSTFSLSKPKRPAPVATADGQPSADATDGDSSADSSA
jgi:PE-PPE domain